MRLPSCLLLLLFCGASTTAQRIEREFQSKVLKESVGLFIALPEGFDASKSYGVLYVLDADGHFNYMVSYVDYLAQPFAHLIPQMIVVGIRSKSPAFRYKNMTPPGAGKDDQGNADAFLTFLCDELKPDVARRYKTDTTQVLAGHSLGGLVTLYCMLKRPTSFTHYIAASPSLGYANGVLLTRDFPAGAQQLGKQKLFYSVAENDLGGYQANAEKFKGMLSAGTWSRWTYSFIEQTDHYSTCPASFYQGLIAVFK